MEEINKKIEELQKLIYIYNKEKNIRIEEITIYIDYSKILTSKINWKNI